MKHSRNLRIGPGGRKCVCCFPAPGKGRKLEYRRAKKLDKKQALKAEKEVYSNRKEYECN